MSRRSLLGAIAAAAFASSPVAAQTVRDLSPEQAQAYQVVESKPGSLSIITLLDRQDATYAVGETVRLAVKSNEDAYITVFNIGASGKVTQLFPNASQLDNKVKAGEAVEIPSAASGTQIRVSGPVGAELIKVIATSKPVAIVADGRVETGTGIFRSVEGGVAALNRDLEVVSANPPLSTKVAIVNQVIKTIPTRLPASPAAAATLVVPVPVAAPPASPAGVGVLPVVGAVPQTFPLLFATDKAAYKVGERLTAAVTTLQACNLTVWGTNTAGQTRLLFPSSTAPANQIGALQTVMISGGVAAQTIVATAAGNETLTALCSSEARALPFAPRSAADILPPEEKAALERDLAVVPTRPAGTAGLAQITITVTP